MRAVMRHASESIEQVWDELLSLAQRHHREQSYKAAFDPQRQIYEAAESVGILRVFTMRDADWKLCGYAGFFVTRHPHMNLKIASQDTLYVLPEHRGFAAGRFLVWCDAALEADGVQQISRVVPAQAAALNLGALGYRDGGKLWVKTKDCISPS
jgi:GNAT superfamily N-acetyltransferase